MSGAATPTATPSFDGRTARRPVLEPRRDRGTVGARSPHVGSPSTAKRPRVEPARHMGRAPARLHRALSRAPAGHRAGDSAASVGPGGDQAPRPDPPPHRGASMSLPAAAVTRRLDPEFLSSCGYWFWCRPSRDEPVGRPARGVAPDQARPDPTRPGPTRPGPTRPGPTRPDQARPDPTGPVDT